MEKDLIKILCNLLDSEQIITSMQTEDKRPELKDIDTALQKAIAETRYLVRLTL